MTRETYTKKTGSTKEVSLLANKSIIRTEEKETYAELLTDKSAFKTFLTEQINAYPELFPDTIHQGFRLFGFVPKSVKQELRLRRIQTIADNQVWQIKPSFVMPYMTMDTDTAQKILFLSRWAPNWALSQVFEKDGMTIERLKTHIGRYSLVGTTVKDADSIPKDVAADEKHAWISGEKVYIATTVAEGCYLGASISPSADEEDLTTSYDQFKQEAQQVQPTYQPNTVNTDGFKSTMNAWKNIFPFITIIQCFFHAVLNIKKSTTKVTMELYQQIREKVWHVYHGNTKRFFSQRLRRLQEWAEILEDSPLKIKLIKLCAKKDWFTITYNFPSCYRTSNMIDRLLDTMDRWLFAKKWFHGKITSAEKGVRAFCLIHNFRPSCPTTVKKHYGQASPFERLNGFTYHHCWLQNMLIATSKQDIYIFQQKKL